MVSGCVEVPRSKSIAQRLIVAGSLADGRTRLTHLPDGQDVQAARVWLREVGGLERVFGDHAIVVRGQPPGPSRGLGSEGAHTWRVGESGTLARFLTAIAALASRSGVELTIEPAGSLRGRGSRALLRTLEACGASPRPTGEGWPVTLRSLGPPSEIVLEQPSSSQEVSGLLIAAAAWPDDIVVRVEGELPSSPYVTMTRALLEPFGVRVSHMRSQGGAAFLVQGSLVAPPDPIEVEPDASAAAVALAAGCLSGGEVEVVGLGSSSVQGDIRILESLRAFGCEAEFTGGTTSPAMRARGGPTRGADLDLSGEPDLAPVVLPLAACVALRTGARSHIAGLGTLEGKESPRLSVLQAQLEALGCAVERTPDSLTVAPGSLPNGPVVLDSHGDHRMAFSGLLLGWVVPEVVVTGLRAIAKSWPSALGDLAAAGAEFHAP